MKELLISEFIDNELQLSEKKVFVQEVAGDPSFSDEVIEMIDFEMQLRSEVDVETPEIDIPVKRKNRWPVLSVIASAAMLMVAVLWPRPELVTVAESELRNRFVIYAPEASSLHLTGTFTQWQKLKMHQIADTGYWEAVLPLKAGEHRYNFIVNNTDEIVDPTAAFTESDDFGGQSSVLLLEG